MAKRFDITDKLAFDGNPMLLIKGIEVEVNADAPTMLKVMGLMDSAGESVEMNAIGEAYELIFPEKSREVIDGMKLSVPDWIVVVESAMDLITGGGEDNLGE